MQTSIGTGLIIGPVLGTFLYSMFDFKNTFFIVGSSLLLTTFILQCLIPNSIDKDGKQKISGLNYSASSYEEHIRPIDHDSVSIFDLLKIAKFTFASMSGMIALFMYAFMEPVLAFRLSELDISNLQTGLFFSIQPVSYVIS